MKYITLIIALRLLALPSHAKRQHTERWYQERHCKGAIEYRLPDAMRVDCLVGGYAIEYDFANKWAEAIGQSMYYAAVTGKIAGVVLILEKQTDCRHIPKIKKTIKDYWIPLDIELIGPDGESGIKVVKCE